MTFVPAGDRVFVVTYTPLVATRHGREAAERHGLPPFIDGSIRREPDLQHEHPAISCLCRAGKFCPRLAPGDRVLYLARKHRYATEAERHWRLTAVLHVIEVFDSHEAAAGWYRQRSLPLPGNCMVPGNEPAPLDQSHRLTPFGDRLPDERLLRLWDGEYRKRAADWGTFAVCEPLFVDLSWGAPVVHTEDLKDAFDRVPGTQNPGTVPLERLMRLMRRLGLSASLSSPQTTPTAARSRRSTAGRSPSGTPCGRSAPPRSACSPTRRTGPGRSRRRGC
jgi:hypothetical protein